MTTTHPTRRSILSALGLALPTTALAASASANATNADLTLRFQPFEQAVREAFPTRPTAPTSRKVEVGHSDLTRSGLQGRHNAKPFAGFPAGHLRITQTGTEPGTAQPHGVRLYVSTVELTWTGGNDPNPEPSQPLDFATLPPAPKFI